MSTPRKLNALNVIEKVIHALQNLRCFLEQNESDKEIYTHVHKLEVCVVERCIQKNATQKKLLIFSKNNQLILYLGFS